MSEKPDLRIVAHVVPFTLFFLFLALPEVLTGVGLVSTEATTPWYYRLPRQWIYPIQSVACLGLVCIWRKQYQLRPYAGWLLGVAAGAVGIVIWLLPGYLFERWGMSDGWYRHLGFVDRRDGFNPFAISESNALIYCPVIFFRFLRLVVVVPLVEEIFWRGFLMRIVTDPDGDYWKVPFGCFHWRSLIVVTAMFVLAHASVDYAAATIYGLLAYFVTVRTKSLSAVIIMHAVANLLLGIYVMATQQWGYW